MNQQHYKKGWFDVSFDEIISLFQMRKDPEGSTKSILFLVGILFTPITLVGAMWGYVRAYNRHLRNKDIAPSLSEIPPIARISMIIWGLLIWVVLVLLISGGMTLMGGVMNRKLMNSPAPYILLGANLLITVGAFYIFNKWRNNVSAFLMESNRFGNARFAYPEDMSDLERNEGIYIGGQVYGYGKQGHFLTIAGTRSGKFVNLIAPNLLGLGGYKGSFVVIDPKGEVAAVTARAQKQKGQNVLVLDPWSILGGEGATYNPLDLISSQKNPEHLADDATIIAEMIVPKSHNGDQFFNNRARAMISGLLMHLVLSQPKSKWTLSTIWKWLRLNDEDWINLMGDMSISPDEVVRAAANEIVSVYNRSEKTFASILSTAQEHTDFLKSPSLQRSLQVSNFNINSLSDGKTTLYVVIPPDKLESHAQWLRLVVTTAMRSVIRNKNKRVTFVLDEFAALGYLPEIKTALSTYAGYNITVWAILQDLGQLKAHYGESWETFLSNTAVRHFFGVTDRFTTDYLSQLFGETTYITYQNNGVSGSTPNASARRLATADEIRRGSADHIFTIVEQRPPTYFPKTPYYEMPHLANAYDPNPYYNPEPQVREAGQPFAQMNAYHNN